MAQAAQQRLAPPADAPIDIAGLPDLYAMQCVGDCMVPELADGSTLLFDRLAPVREGDLVVIWKRPELVPPGAVPAIVKRLVKDWFKESYPYTPHPDDNVTPTITVEQLNPRRRFHIPCDRIQAVHRCLGPVTRMPDGTAGAAQALIDAARRGE
jgi:phage repressor protein C with HTH and peptisase S24 domain